MATGSSDMSASSTYTDQAEVFSPSPNNLEVLVNQGINLVGQHFLIIISVLLIAILSFVLAAVLLT
jgi:hypothetical protein